MGALLSPKIWHVKDKNATSFAFIKEKVGKQIMLTF
jgi:hypothetical protein